MHACLGLWASARLAIEAARWQLHTAREAASEQPPGPEPLLAAVLVLPTLPGGGFIDILANRILLMGFWAWFLAQFAKVFTKRIKKGVWDPKAVVDSGGMPSSHSALCAAVTTGVALQYGLGSPLFALAITFSVIVMYDAMGVRQHAGKQAEVLNQLVNELLEEHSLSKIKLKEVLGHTPMQVIAGGILGIMVGLFFPFPAALA